MALDVLAQGKLVKAPEQRTARNGSPFALAQLSVSTDGDESILCSLITFRVETVAAMLALDAGDALAVAGRAKVTTWTNRDGETKAGLSITVDQLLTAYHVKRKRSAVQDDDHAPDESTTLVPASEVHPQCVSRIPRGVPAVVEAEGVADMADDLRAIGRILPVSG